MHSRRVKKVLFLDVDGVLNNGTWASAMHEQEIDVYKRFFMKCHCKRSDLANWCHGE